MLGQSNGLRYNREAALSSIKETIDDGSYFADLFANQRVTPPIYHYIITRKGSNEVIDWGQSFSLDSARSQAQQYLVGMARKIAS